MRYLFLCQIVYTLVFVSTFGSFATNHVFADSSSTVTTTVAISVCGNGIKEGGEQCDDASFNGKSCRDLGFKSGELQCSASCEFVTTACISDAKKNVGLLFNSSIGGNHTLQDDDIEATVALSPGFYSKDLRLQMFSYEYVSIKERKPAVLGKNFIGNVYDFFFVDPDGELQSVLSLPAQLTLTYLDADFVGFDEETIAPYHWGEGDTSWEEVSGGIVNTETNTVVFETPTFSSFALFASPVEEPSESLSSGWSSGGSISSYSGQVPATTIDEHEEPKKTVFQSFQIKTEDEESEKDLFKKGKNKNEVKQETALTSDQEGIIFPEKRRIRPLFFVSTYVDMNSMAILSPALLGAIVLFVAIFLFLSKRK